MSVVVGAGLSGLRTIEGLRRNGYAGPIDLVGAEVHAPYDRPPLTKAVLRGTLPKPRSTRSWTHSTPGCIWAKPPDRAMPR